MQGLIRLQFIPILLLGFLADMLARPVDAGSRSTISHHASLSGPISWDTVFTELVACEGDGFIVFWNGEIVDESNPLSCYPDSVEQLIRCVHVTFLPTTYGFVEMHLCGEDTLLYAEGTFVEVIPNHAGCDSVITLTVTYCTTSSTQELYFQTEPIIFPNPTTGNFRVRVPGSASARYEIISLDGMVRQNGIISPGNPEINLGPGCDESHVLMVRIQLPQHVYVFHLAVMRSE